MASPYAVSWLDTYWRPGDESPQRGTKTIYARSNDEASYLFCQSHGMRMLVTGVELDVKQGELDVAMIVAYRARQNFHDPAKAALHVQRTLTACMIRITDVAPFLQKHDLPI